MAQPYVTGPVPVWCGIGSSGSPLFLGHTERTPRMQVRPSFSPVYCDIGGQKTPFDQIYDGEDGIVTLDMIRFNEPVYAILAGRPQSHLGVSARGTNFPGDIGTLMVTEGVTFDLWLPFPYSAKVSMATMPAGYRWAAAYLMGPDELEPLGTQPRKLRLVFHCLRKFDVTYTNTLGQGKFTLYDHNMAGISGLLFD